MDYAVSEEQINKLLAEYDSLNQSQKDIVNLFLKDPNNFEKYYYTIKNMFWKCEPPTPEQFLDPRYGFLPVSLIDSLYDYVKDDFVSAMRTQDPFHTIVMYGSTRCESEGTKVLMWDMSLKNIEDVVVGDRLMGDDSTPREVLEIISGEDTMYEVQQNKGLNYTVNGHHKLVLQYTGFNKKNGERDERCDSIIEIPVREYLNLNNHQKHILKGVKTSLDFAEQEVPIDPYLCGVWLGDGSSRVPAITSMDKEIVDYIYDYADKNNLNVRVETKSNYSNKAKTYYLVGNTTANQFVRNDNVFNYALKDNDLIQNKHIPRVYLKNSREIRLQLLAGIIDTDGSKNKTGYDICIKSERLANDISLLCHSLGYRANVKKSKRGIKKLGF
jgi:replicative DNA helicase